MKYTYYTHSGGKFDSHYVFDREQMSDVWFCEGNGEANFIGEYTYRDKKMAIYCLGEMRVNFEDGTVWRSAWDIPADIKNDKELMDRLEAPDADVINNCWLELFDINGADSEETWLVCGDIEDALEEAHAYIVATYPEVEG